ncbi:S41 family peptidase [Belliella kenyensis]|uniref:S41 family peptidase n=1 Tax=Belliella kenyensis TaxID=1472724 RepID=A0ABV8EMZ9_9BACT|nr:S41 family peptidase [Belliella kenyensis]MCH7403048.1 S41 family peptidase [Belliella kenyensis]MDN3605085.1 S41 family peptidase [Belliella kenyensis]
MKNCSNFKHYLLMLTLLASIALTSSCKDKEDIEPVEETEEEDNNTGVAERISTNLWIKEIMDTYYYWLEDMRPPIANTSDPEDYFEALLYTPTDRFSAIYPNFQELINSLSGVSTEAGYEIALLRESSTNNNVIALVLYVKKDSPAKAANIQRGDLITQINGTTMTLTNYQTVLRGRNTAHNVTLRKFNEAGSSFGAPETVSVNAVELEENPNFYHSVITDGSHKIGYLVYHFFAPGKIDPISGDTDSRYDDEMAAIFAEFKAENVNQLILDFRYNGGGYVSSANNLASLIVPNFSPELVFSKTRFNSFLSRFSDFQNVQTRFTQKSQNIGDQLVDKKIYILTSGRTASASELIINGLRPYLDIVLIGETTTGKNVGSFAIEDEDNPKNTYGLLPIVSKSFNSLNQSDYSTGFTPTIEVDEFDFFPWREFGDTRDPLLQTAISSIKGNISGGRIRGNVEDRMMLETSLERKARFGRQIESLNDVQLKTLKNR